MDYALTDVNPLSADGSPETARLWCSFRAYGQRGSAVTLLSAECFLQRPADVVYMRSVWLSKKSRFSRYQSAVNFSARRKSYAGL